MPIVEREEKRTVTERVRRYFCDGPDCSKSYVEEFREVSVYTSTNVPGVSRVDGIDASWTPGRRPYGWIYRRDARHTYNFCSIACETYRLSKDAVMKEEESAG